MDTSNGKFLVGIFDDDDVVLKAVTTVRDAGVRIHEVYTPFPIHGQDSQGLVSAVIYSSR